MNAPQEEAALFERTKTLALPTISEIVLQTSQFALMRDWYRSVLGRDWVHEAGPSNTKIQNEHGDGGKQVHASRVQACFMILDIEAPAEPPGQLFALFGMSGIRRSPTKDPGLNHLQFKHRSRSELLRRASMLRAAGVMSHRAANHGPVTSFYYKDPDQNVVELCANNFPTMAEFHAYLTSAAFKTNPSGYDFDFDAALEKFEAGLPLEEVVL